VSFPSPGERPDWPPETPVPEVPTIVADFDYAGHNWLIVFWPPDQREDPWQVYRADLPWYWLKERYEDARV
jgi:hypothetical protein